MFKYGSIRLFFIKFLLGVIFLFFSAFSIGSFIFYNKNDPGFNNFVSVSESTGVQNSFGLFGAYLSSYFLVILGTFSYLIMIFILIESLKSLLGFKSKSLIIRFFSNFFGISLLSYFFHTLSSNFFNTGLLSYFVSEIFVKYIFIYLNSYTLEFLFNLVVVIIGIIFILYSFSLKIKYFKFSFKLFKIFKFLKYFKLILYFINSFRKKSYTKINNKKSEPTIKRGTFIETKNKIVSGANNINQTEMDRFRFALPSNDLLLKSTFKNILNKEFSKINTDSANKLQQTLSEYGVEGKIVGYRAGPIVTLFEFVPNAGIKSSKVIGLSEDIARAMSSVSARISSQPGKTSLGIEIPNQKRESVFFGDLIEDQRFNNNNDSLILALGKDISGDKVYTDLEKMPHLLIAGTTGSGKSVGINTMILSLLFRFKPNECKLILIDPKMLELSIYEDIPHLLTPVVTDPKKAVFALKWVVKEMENRYKLMSSVNVKNITSYNSKVLKTISSGRKLFREVQTGIDNDTRNPIIEKREIKLEKMPFIVVVIDEMADLMMVAGKEVESLVQRLAQMARASGIHLITATQRPSVDVITGTIKANFPSRISYKVASKFDSRTILNEMGAEQLLGSGDMLFLENGASIKRLHGGFVSESEVEKVVKYIKNQATFNYKNEISLQEVETLSKSTNDLISDNTDDLYNKAVEIIVKQQKVSTSFIQRYLQIGYNRAARIVEKMEEDGIISEANNAGKRHVLKKK